MQGSAVDSLLLGQQRVVGKGSVQLLGDQPLAGQIGVGHQVARPLLPRGDPAVRSAEQPPRLHGHSLRHYLVLTVFVAQPISSIWNAPAPGLTEMIISPPCPTVSGWAGAHDVAQVTPGFQAGTVRLVGIVLQVVPPGEGAEVVEGQLADADVGRLELVHQRLVTLLGSRALLWQ